MDTPVVKIPLVSGQIHLYYSDSYTYHADPTTDRPMQRAIPKLAHVKGETLSRNAPTWRMCVR